MSEQNLYKLEKVVDFKSKGVDLHPTTVADVIVEWRLLVPNLGLTEVEEHVIYRAEMVQLCKGTSEVRS